MDISKDRIRERAYEIWDGAGRPGDQAVEHWLQAEREFGIEPVDGPVEGREPGPDERVETLADPGKPELVTLTRPAPDSVEAEG